MENFFNALFQETFTSNVSLKIIFITLLVSFVLGIATSWVYKKTFRGVSYTSSFVSSLILLPLISSLVLLTIGSNIARAFGLVGTLAIIRFRTPVKDPKDLIYIFLSLVIGIISGTQNYHIAIVGVPMVLLIMYILEKLNYGSFANNQYFFTFKVKKDNFKQDDIETILNDNCKYHSLNSLNSVYNEKDALRVVYKITLMNKSSEQNILKELSGLNNIENASLVSSENYVEY